jgi:Carboxypeptidase regulatory-like domain
MKWHSMKRGILVYCLTLIFGLTCAWAQNGTTSLRGTITDSKGASVPGATVTLTNSSLGISVSTKTDKDGGYQFLELRPATYAVTVTSSGFATVHQAELQLLVATPRTQDFRLEVASISTTIEVTGTAQAINTTDATLGNAFGPSQIAALPFEGRDPAGMLSLQPGVVSVSDPQIQKDNESFDSRSGSVNGARSDQTNITLDGVDDNDQLYGYAFQGALRATLDSIEEFRVTTSNAGADQGRSSGGQVSLQTKSGSNQFHGTAYEYNRPTNLVANQYFNKLAELQNGEPNTPPFLLRNTFGATFGGPIIKDRLFFFVAYEGQRLRENSQVTRTVPSAALRDGVIFYQCASTAACPGDTVQGLSGASYTAQPGFNALSPSQIATMDPNCTSLGTCPLGPGVDPDVIKTLNEYPLPNSNQQGYGYNYQAYTFSSPAPQKQDTYIARFDYNLNSDGTQRLFARLGLQNDHSDGVEQFPGQPASTVDTNNTKGIVTGYLWTISPTKINNFHYGYIRQGIGENGISTQPLVFLRGLDDPTAYTRTTNVIVPVHNFTDDFTWTAGRHTLTFGGNYRFVNNIRNSNADSFSDALTNTGFLEPTGISNQGGSFDPAAFGFPAVSTDAQNAYDYPMIALAGILTEEDNTYVQDKSGQFLPQGSFVPRHFRENEVEFYGMDSWRIKPNLTMTYGLRYSLLQPPYETNGNQVCPSQNLGQFFQTRMTDMVEGISYAPNFSFDLCGAANGKPGYWNWDRKDFAPRWSLAWSPSYSEGLLGSLFGGAGKSSIRLGGGVYYDHFGEGIVNTFDRNGSFGFVTTGSLQPGTVSLDTAPRYTGINDLPPSLEYPPPTPGFPVTPDSNFLIYYGLDSNLKTPYAYGFDLSFTRELKAGFTIELAYVNRLGRRLLQERDLAQPLNLVDPKTKVSYFQAVTALAKIDRTGESIEDFAANPNLPANIVQYWTDMMQPLLPGGAYSIGGSSCVDGGSPTSTTSPLVAAYALFCGGIFNETTPLSDWDLAGIPDARNAPNCGTTGNPACAGFYFPINGPDSFYQGQFASLYAESSIGRSNYNAGQFMIRHRLTHGLTWDFNYTYSKSIDEGSNAERISLPEGFGYASQIINAFDPGQNRAVSDWDMTHQINSNWVYELPFGRGQKWGSSSNAITNAIFGGWSFSGLYRWSSGLPFSVSNGFQFPTNWDLTGQANLVGPAPATGVGTNCSSGSCNPNVFVGATGGTGSAVNAFDYPFPGESGARNNLRGPGYFDIDAGARKSWNFTESTKLAFGFDVFNLTNSVRFDPGSITSNGNAAIDSGSAFGNFESVLTGSRRIEISLRFIF